MKGNKIKPINELHEQQKKEIEQQKKEIEQQKKEIEQQKKEIEQLSATERDTLWQNNLMKIFENIKTSYVWYFRFYINQPERSCFLNVSSGCYHVIGLTKEQLITHKSEECLMQQMLTDESYVIYMNDMTNYITGKICSNDQYYTLTCGKKINVVSLVHVRNEEYIDFIGKTRDAEEKHQLELILESSDDLIMIDDVLQNDVAPKLINVSNSWNKFGFLENPCGRYIHEFISKEMYQECSLIKETQIKQTGTWSTIQVQGKINGIDVEINVSKMGYHTLSIGRDITDRIKRHEAEKALAIETTTRNKDADANRWVRHEVKNSLLEHIIHIDSIIQTNKLAVEDNSYKDIQFHNRMVDRLNILYTDVEHTLQTILSDAMAKDIINGEYKAKKEKCDIMSIIKNIKCDRYKWVIVPRHIPSIISDKQLIFYIIRNALSNANKYGQQWGDITVKISIINNMLEIRVINYPGEQHEKLLMLENPNIIFNKGIRLHKKIFVEPFNETTINSKSSGDGAWIIKTCSELCGGNSSIRFESDKTTYTFTCPIELYVASYDVENFIFPNNTIIYLVDDSKIQRKLLHRQIINIGIAKSNCIVIGENASEIIGLYDILYSHIISKKNYYHVIICDENLDYKTNNGETHYKSGSYICKTLITNLPEKNSMFLMRSANDSDQDIGYYNSITHGFIPKVIMSTEELIRLIAKFWIKQFGIISAASIYCNFDDDTKYLIENLIEEIDLFLKYNVNKNNWKAFWSELHIIKGSLCVVECLKDESSICIIKQIECMRNNNFNENFDTLYSKLTNSLYNYKNRL
jgi:alkyl hydroperoxide reductase subunit AhpC